MHYLLLIIIIIFMSGCSSTSSTDSKQTGQQEKLQAEGDRQVGLPKITNFTEKKLLSMLYELRDQASLPTWTYYLDLNGNKHLLCRSVGYGIPYATQFSNPKKFSYDYSASFAMPQCEPNGLFMPSAAEGTWIFMATEKGPKPLYCEPKVIVSPVPLKGEKNE